MNEDLKRKIFDLKLELPMAKLLGRDCVEDAKLETLIGNEISEFGYQPILAYLLIKDLKPGEINNENYYDVNLAVELLRSTYQNSRMEVFSDKKSVYTLNGKNQGPSDFETFIRRNYLASPITS